MKVCEYDPKQEVVTVFHKGTYLCQVYPNKYAMKEYMTEAIKGNESLCPYDLIKKKLLNEVENGNV